jgi:hypothetical protein
MNLNYLTSPPPLLELPLCSEDASLIRRSDVPSKLIRISVFFSANIRNRGERSSKGGRGKCYKMRRFSSVFIQLYPLILLFDINTQYT